MTLSLMSPSLLALAAVTAIVMAALEGPARKVVFLCANVVFLWGRSSDPRARCRPFSSPRWTAGGRAEMQCAAEGARMVRIY